DAVVHSWKDLPTEENPETFIAATLPRADARDVLLFKKTSLERSDVTISSSSPRREYNGRSFLKTALPWKVNGIVFQSVRGNIPTRIAKFMEGDADGSMLARAALDRLLVNSDEGGAESAELKSLLNRVLDACRFMVMPL